MCPPASVAGWSLVSRFPLYVPKGRVESMRKFVTKVAEFLKREDGPTAVEYAVMLALIIVVCITAITTLGTNANKTFSSVGNTIGSTSGS
jgi:pilus assembly protein Flp/PilA